LKAFQLPAAIAVARRSPPRTAGPTCTVDDHELLFAAWDELKHRDAAVTYVPTGEYNGSFDLVDAGWQAKGEDIAALRRDRATVAKALIDLVAQEATAYRASPDDVGGDDC
jgi:hypothetical protein